MVNGKLHHSPSQGHVLQENQAIIKTVVSIQQELYLYTSKRAEPIMMKKNTAPIKPTYV